jgi:hypothetical protein
LPYLVDGPRKLPTASDWVVDNSSGASVGHYHNAPAAVAAIAATLPDGSEAESRPDDKGGYLVTLPRGVLDRLKAMRGRGESYSAVILRVARG